MLVIAVFLAGFVMLTYPFFGNSWNEHYQTKIVTQYDDSMEKLEQARRDEEWEKADAYNRELVGNVVLSDPFNVEGLKEQNKEYDSLLNMAQDGMMCSIEIPSIGVNLPVYHGTGDAVLEKGTGHLVNTSLPVGGPNTHCVLSGHTGLSTAILFTDLDKLVEGDLFYLHVLGQVLAYEVDQINVVVPTDISNLMIEPEQDYVTLVTCTPYGINSHRLLVRGHRTAYTPEQKQEQEKTAVVHKETWRETYARALKLALTVLVILFVILMIVLISRGIKGKGHRKKGRNRRKRRRRRKQP